MCKVGVIFPGQGSQFPLMGEDFYNNFETYQNTFNKVFLQNPGLKAIWENKESEEINLTKNAQLILFANQMSIFKVIEDKFEVTNECYAGFSLGEYTALCAANFYDYELGLEIVKNRADFMGEIKSDYTTKVCLGKTKAELEKMINVLKNDFNIEVIISNYNLEKQLLINYETQHDNQITTFLKENGIKRLVDIKVSGPFHTPIYKKASEKLFTYMQNIDLNTNVKPLYLNYTSKKFQDENIKEVMKNQMINGVLWYNEIVNMIEDGINTFVEIGSKSILSSMIKKINKDVEVITIEKIDDLQKLEELWNKK